MAWLKAASVEAAEACSSGAKPSQTTRSPCSFVMRLTTAMQCLTKQRRLGRDRRRWNGPSAATATGTRVQGRSITRMWRTRIRTPFVLSELPPTPSLSTTVRTILIGRAHRSTTTTAAAWWKLSTSLRIHSTTRTLKTLAATAFKTNPRTTSARCGDVSTANGLPLASTWPKVNTH